MSSIMDENETDWYAILGCTSKHTKEQISKAARKLALKYHPDKNSDPSAIPIFQRIQKAKEFLTDDTKRKEYDDKQNAILKRKEYDKQKMKNMDSNRKRMREELESRMQFHQGVNKDKETNVKDTTGIGKARADGMRRRETSSSENYERSFGKRPATEQEENNSLRQVKIKWKRSRMSHSDDSLYSLFGEYGAIEEVVLTGSKGNSALITFSHPESAKRAVHSHISSEDMRVSLVSESHKEVEKSSIFSFGYNVDDRSVDSGKDINSRVGIDNFLKRMNVATGAQSSLNYETSDRWNDQNDADVDDGNNGNFKENIELFLSNEREILLGILRNKNATEVNMLLSSMKNT